MNGSILNKLSIVDVISICIKEEKKLYFPYLSITNHYNKIGGF